MNKKPEDKNQTAEFLKTDKGKSKSNAIEIPSISLPKGGGAIKGIDEKFSVNAVNGTSSLSIPLPFSPARGASPLLSLSYSSGAGNGIFGLGWSLSLGSIKRKTDKGLPQYFDSIDSDIFLFSEAEDLVPEFKKEKKNDGSIGFELDNNGVYVINEKDSPDGLFKIRFYRPRIEGLFARIERWTEKATGRIKWRVITKENTTTLFGWTDNSIISNPDDNTKIYEWLPEFVFDDKGNCSQNIYEKEDEKDFDISLLHNRNRYTIGANGKIKISYTNIYLKKIFYGNKTPYKQFGDALPGETDYMFQTIFDYGTLLINDSFETINNWTFRPDAFSDYKAGFEIRTTRLCKRVLLFHHFTGINEYEGLVKSINFEYDTSTEQDFTFLKSITSYGYIKKPDGTYSHKKLPAMEFEYQKHDWSNVVKTISSEALVHAPSGLDEPQYQFTDLFNEGLSGILTEQANGWYYKHNLGNGQFEQAKLVSPKPSFAGLGRQMQLADLDADGGKQLVSFSTEPRGYFELDDENEWHGLRSFKALPNIDFGDANTRMLDLNGDGKPEVVISEDNVFTWYASEGRDGYATAQKTSKPFDEEAGPHIVFADAIQTIYLTDMSGDGMTDILRIRNGEVCYWPNLGYGKFGAKVAMDNSPVFDFPDAFNPAYLRLADIDGSGTSDIIYFGKNKFTCWKNLSGNRFSTTPFEIDTFPEIHSQAKISATDLLGNGVACIVWSSPLAKDANAPLKYIDLMNSKKPHIMINYKNNMGKEVSMEYLPSTHFYIKDKKAGNPWITKLHFPVHCLVKTVTKDKISGYVFANEYSYHHGYYDHPEREFRGFGMVEQKDTEVFETWKKRAGTNVLDNDDLNQPPVISKTWVHTGALLRSKKILDQFEKEYWFEEMNRTGFPINIDEYKLPDAKIIDEHGKEIDKSKLDALDWQEALRACKGMALRSEIFSMDDNKQIELTPYSAASHNCIIQRLQPRGNNKHAVFIVKESEAITYSYERDTDDPRIAHNLNIKFDDMGNVLEAASVVYPRKPENIHALFPDVTKEAQKNTYITYVENTFTNDINEDNAYRLRLPSEVKTYELKGDKFDNPTRQFTIVDFDNPLDSPPYNILISSQEVRYDQYDVKPLIGTQKRLIEHVRTTYYRNALTGALPLHKLESLALPCEYYQLAYTPELLTEIYSAKATDIELANLMTEGKFSHSIDEFGNEDTNWWIRSGTAQFIEATETAADAQNRFYVPISYTDPYESKTKVKYYSNYFLFIEETEDVLGNKARIENIDRTKPGFNFRTLSPQWMKDINGNFSTAISDELGLVKAMAVMGKGLQADELTGLEEITNTAESILINSFFQATDSVQLTTTGKNLLNHASSRFGYDFDAYKKIEEANKQHVKNEEPDKVKPLPPSVIASITRETHYRMLNEIPNPNESKVQIAFEYSNGVGEVVMKKVQAEPGIAKEIIVHADNTYILTTPDPDTSKLNPKQLRWIGNGRTIKNNKGNAVKQYEPYFSINWHYEDFKELVETGVTPILYYDAMGRLIKTKMPDDTFSKVEFDSWKQISYDANDTVTDSDWYKKRTDNTRIDYINDGNEKTAADKSADHYNTPSELHMDTLGRPILQIENNGIDLTGVDILYKTKIELDIEGNLRKVTDARILPENADKGNLVMQYKYDMLGNLVYQNSMDAGQRWLLHNVLGNPLRTWDERDHEFHYEYDKLHRPTQSIVINKVGKPGDQILNNIFDKIIYGESLLTGIRTDTIRFNEAALQTRNVLGQVIQHYDTGGLVDTPDYDFKGQPMATTRKLFKKYKEVTNWIDANLAIDLEAGTGFTFTTDTDALGRITQQTTPDGSIITPSYNEAGLLDGESVLHPGEANPAVYIKDIGYNEKGQRNFIKYGNGVRTTFEYDKKTFRLINLVSNKNNKTLQDLYYTYDPVGNILRVEDKANDTSFFKNMQVEPVSEYTYDALYRLKEAKGRENGSALNFTSNDNWNDIPKMIPQHQPGNPMAVESYTERYTYDEVGNISEINHLNSWTRTYEYETNSNRLINTKVGTQTFLYPHHPLHGYITKMSHLDDMGWNFKEELVKTIKQRVIPGNGTAETTYYQYDGQGQRIRKVTENSAKDGKTPTKKDERIYIAGYELYKKPLGNQELLRVSLSLMDGDHRFVMIETRNEVDDGTEKKLVRYQLHNHLGSACLELNDAANPQIISYEEYHSYGTTSYQAINPDIKAAAKRYRYTGLERDEETGFGYHRARYYLPWLGRWASADPLIHISSNNNYSYSANKPTILIDLSGLEEQVPDPAIRLRRNAALGRIYERQWGEYFRSRPDTLRVIPQTTWKDPKTGKSVMLGGKTRKPDFAVEVNSSPGEATAVEVSSPPNFGSSNKAAQAARDIEAIDKKLNLGNRKTGFVQGKARFEARGLPVVGDGGNVPGAKHVIIDKATTPKLTAELIAPNASGDIHSAPNTFEHSQTASVKGVETGIKSTSGKSIITGIGTQLLGVGAGALVAQEMSKQKPVERGRTLKKFAYIGGTLLVISAISPGAAFVLLLGLTVSHH